MEPNEQLLSRFTFIAVSDQVEHRSIFETSISFQLKNHYRCERTLRKDSFIMKSEMFIWTNNSDIVTGSLVRILVGFCERHTVILQS